MDARDTYIAGWKTPDDWRNFKQRLLSEKDDNLWREAHKDYFLGRLNLRYFHPIKVLRENGSFTGEGFSIMAILCTLVEFLESTHKGLSYRYARDLRTLGPYEYASSRDIFENFLCNQVPFNKHFDKDTAGEFYKSIRCGLLHEAQTKNGWRIHAESYEGKLIDESRKIIYRNNFERSFEEFIKNYGENLIEDEKLQAAFIRKFDSLCL